MAALTPGTAPSAVSLLLTLWLPPHKSSGLYTSTVGSPSANAALPPHPYCQNFYPLLLILYLLPLPLAPGHPSMPPICFPPDFLRVLQWNAGDLPARNTELLHFLLSHPVDPFCIQESNLSSSSPFQIPGFSALHFDHTHFWSGILSRDTTHASSSDGIILVRQGLSFSFSLLDPYFDYLWVNISLGNSSLLSFNVYAPPICSSSTSGRTDSFSPSILPFSKNLFILGNFNCHHSF